MKEREIAGVSELKDHMLFLRMAAIELRRVAKDAPAVGTRLQQIISQLDAEATHLSKWVASRT